jgi:hypothetical protein
MNIAAIVANVAQLAIILVVFFLRGLELGGLVIFLLFLLMVVPFVNLLAFLLSSRTAQAWNDAEVQADGMIKRKAMRIHYSVDRRPVFSTDGIAYAVQDISEGGVRIVASADTVFKKKIDGEVLLLCGEVLQIKARVLRGEGGEVVLQFLKPIGTVALLKEKKALAGGSV